MGDQAFYGGGVGETRNNVFQAVGGDDANLLI